MKKSLITTATGVLVSSLVLGYGPTADAIKNQLQKKSVSLAATSNVHEHEHLEERIYDVRIEEGLNVSKISPKHLAAAQKMIQTNGAGIKVAWDSMFGTPRMVYRDKGYITKAQKGTAESIARNWLKQNAAMYGLTTKDIEKLNVIRDFKLPGSELNPVVFQQTFNGIESVYGGRIIVSVNKEGRILTVTGDARPSGKLSENYKLTEVSALQKAIKAHLPSFSTKLLKTGVENGWTVFSAGDALPTVQRVKKAAFFTKDEVRPAYRVLYVEKLNKGYEVVVDGVTGETLYQRDLVDYLTANIPTTGNSVVDNTVKTVGNTVGKVKDTVGTVVNQVTEISPKMNMAASSESSQTSLLDPEGLVFENIPYATNPEDGSRISYDGSGSQVVKSMKGDPVASPLGWFFPLNEGALTTIGNNANAFANWSNFLAPEAPGVVRPVAALGKFKYPFHNAWNKTQGEIAPPSYAEDVHSATTNLFYQHNLFHDYYYKLGWVEEAGNLQATNLGRGGLDGDPILGLVQAGALSGGDPTYTGRDNAYMLTLPDGTAAWSGMFLWEPIAYAFEGNYTDGDYDAGIIYHEYSHALSNRYVAGGEALGSHQAGSMGEGWGDFFGMHYLIKEGLQENPVVGAYVTGNNDRGIRNYSLSDAPYNYGDVGYDIIGPEVHADGDIWAAILWNVRETLIEKFGKLAGEQITEQVVMDGMPISAPNPSFADMSFAIVKAAEARFGVDSEEVSAIWKGFAQRGLGAGVIVTDLGKGNSTDPTPSFAHIDANLNGMITGTLVDAGTGNAIKGARIIIGEFEARTTEVAKTDEDGRFHVPVVEGNYTITIQAPGYGSRTLRSINVEGGETTWLNGHTPLLPIEVNLASATKGATIVEPANGFDEQESNPISNVIDDTEATVYASGLQDATGFKGTEFVIDLAGESHLIHEIQVSAFKDISKSRFATLRDFEIHASVDGTNWNKLSLNGKQDQTFFKFEDNLPRPATPDLHYKKFILNTPTNAKFLKFVAKTTQNPTSTYVQVADVQVFSKGAKAFGEPTPPPKLKSPIELTGSILGGNPATGAGQLAGVDATGAVTENEFVLTKNSNPVSQGVDGYVFTLPVNAGYDANTDTFNKVNYNGYTISVEGTGEATGQQDLDVYFYSKDFTLLGSIATSGANEGGVVPGGTHYVYVGLYTGAAVDVKVTLQAPQN